MATSVYEAEARAAKVQRLIHQTDLLPTPVETDLLPALGDDFWLPLARMARVNPPSEATRAAVVATLRARDEARTNRPAAESMFEGLV